MAQFESGGPIYAVRPEDRVYQGASLSFDLSVGLGTTSTRSNTGESRKGDVRPHSPGIIRRV